MTNQFTKEKYIDVAKSIKESDSKLLTKLPSFVVRLISKIVKEKQINEFKSKEKISEEIKEVKPEITHFQDEELMYQAMYNNGN